jgi:hypothetical protein
MCPASDDRMTLNKLPEQSRPNVVFHTLFHTGHTSHACSHLRVSHDFKFGLQYVFSAVVCRVKMTRSLSSAPPPDSRMHHLLYICPRHLPLKTSGAYCSVGHLMYHNQPCECKLLVMYVHKILKAVRLTTGDTHQFKLRS